MGVNSSFSADAKDALARDVPEAPHCREALLASLAVYGCGTGANAFVTHRNAVARLFRSLALDERRSIVKVADARLMRAVGYRIDVPERLRAIPPKPMHKCDRVMEVRGAFLACGCVSAGRQGYHLEFVLRDRERAERLAWMLRALALPPKRMERKHRDVLYYKDFEAIVDVLTIVGAHGAVLHLSDIHALKETKNRIHRLVNTEAANLERTAAAAAAACRTIQYVESAYGLRNVSPVLREIAALRLAHPEENLAELGRRCNPPVGKPTVGSRLAALTRLAARLQRGRESRTSLRD